MSVDDDASFAVAQLEQRALELELEVERRRRLEDRMFRLLELTGQLSAAQTRADVARIATRNSRQAVGGTAAMLWQLSADRKHLELLATTEPGDPQRYRVIDVDGDTPLGFAVREEQAVFLGTPAEYRERFPDSFARTDNLRRSEHVALAVLPVIGDSRVMGGLTFAYDHERTFGGADRTFKEIVARHCALSLERVALHEQERQLREAAEEATRAREEILSVVSHDLRNPLGAILIGASSLLQIDTERNHRISGVAERIHRQAERMARLIEDLVDFAGIQAGKLALEPTDHSPTEIIHAATDLFTPLAQERGLVFEAKVQPDLPPIRCDSDRALQVISNLVSNAFKVTPRGHHVTIGAESRATDVVFYVSDDGPGIDKSELPLLFERYWRGKTSHYRGAGLGLSIARGIVDAHGGKIWVESTLGVGSTFYFSLSPRN